MSEGRARVYSQGRKGIEEKNKDEKKRKRIEKEQQEKAFAQSERIARPSKKKKQTRMRCSKN